MNETEYIGKSYIVCQSLLSRFKVIDHFPKYINHFPSFIDQLRTDIVHFPEVIDHFPRYIVI